MNDIQNYFIEQGKGNVLILLHGNEEDSSSFHAQIQFFSKQYHVYAIDTRGHGFTPWGNKPFCLDTFVDDLHAFVLEHDIQSAHILGFRMVEILH